MFHSGLLRGEGTSAEAAIIHNFVKVKFTCRARSLFVYVITRVYAVRGSFQQPSP